MNNFAPPTLNELDGKYYTTVQVAKICGYENSRVVSGMIARGELKARLASSSGYRRTLNVVFIDDLAEHLRKLGLPLSRLEIKWDAEVQEWFLKRSTKEFRAMIEKARSRGGVLSQFHGLSCKLLDLVRNLDPVTKLDGRSEDRKRAKIFAKLVSVIELHVGLRELIAKKKRQLKKKAG